MDAIPKGPPAQTVTLPVPPVRKSIRLACPAAEGFARFTRDIGRWWPTARFSLGAERVTAVLMEPYVGGRILERHADGTEHTWGTILAWNPPAELRFTWFPGSTAETAQQIAVAFRDLPDATSEVELVHAGWETLGALAQTRRDEYDGGWEEVFIRCYGGFAAA